jgi:hypothetical protein
VPSEDAAITFTSDERKFPDLAAVAIPTSPIPFALSLSKGRPCFGHKVKKKRAFDKLRPNGG